MVDSASLIFYSSLLACVPLGNVYKKIDDVETKRRLGAGIGILVTLLICGPYIYHTVLLIVGNVLTVKYCDKRYVHQASLLFTWLYLLYINFNVECPKYASWLFQHLALKLVGLAFEINIYDKNLSRQGGKAAASMPVDDSISRLSSTDIITYAYFFIGLHKGPYYTWKVFNDHLQTTSHVRGDFWRVTEQKLRKAFLLSLVYFVMRSKYPISMYTEDEFYTNYGSDYRFLISLPQLVIYYIEYQIILMLSTSACTEAGFGVYPSKCLAVPGAGPTVPCKLTGEAAGDKEEYNFSMLKCFNNQKLLMGPRMKDTVRGWDMSTRYWFSQYIVKSLVNNNFEVRSACSFLIWTIWVGPTIQNIIIALTLWVYIHLESDYAQLYADALSGPWDFGFAIMRMFCLFYLTPCYIIEDKDTILRYYNSIYWMYHIVLGVLALLAIAINKSRIRAQVGTATEDSRLQKLFRELKSSNLSLARTVSMDVRAAAASEEGKTQPPQQQPAATGAPGKQDSTTPDSGATTSGAANTNDDPKVSKQQN